jgi:hypothetical protein
MGGHGASRSFWPSEDTTHTVQYGELLTALVGTRTLDTFISCSTVRVGSLKHASVYRKHWNNQSKIGRKGAIWLAPVVAAKMDLHATSIFMLAVH